MAKDKQQFKIDFTPVETWAGYTILEKIDWIKSVLHGNSGNISGKINSNLSDLFEILHRASSPGSVYRKLSDLGLICLKSTKFISEIEGTLTKKNLIATTQFDYIMKYLPVNNVDELDISDFALNSEVTRLFAENIRALESRGNFAIKKIEYDRSDKNTDVRVNYVLQYNGDIEVFKGSELFVRCVYVNSNASDKVTPAASSKGEFVIAFKAYQVTEDDIVNEMDANVIHDISQSIIMIALRNYVECLDVSQNYIKLDPFGDMQAIPRTVIPFAINNFDMDGVIGEMKKCLSIGKHRGYMFIGDPGTGKTASIQKMVEHFTDIPIFWVDSSSLTTSAIREVFKTLHFFPKSICIFDDIDALNLSEKSAKTSAFIECMDGKDIRTAYSGITIMTVNEPTRVHSSITTRPGRTDKIIYIDNPRTKEVVFDIMRKRYDNAGIEMPSVISLKNECLVEVINKCIANNFTHAHIAGIIDDLIYLSDGNQETLISDMKAAIDDRISSIQHANLKTKNGYFDHPSDGKSSDVHRGQAGIIV